MGRQQLSAPRAANNKLNVMPVKDVSY